jgi:hypothetical protein
MRRYTAREERRPRVAGHSRIQEREASGPLRPPEREASLTASPELDTTGHPLDPTTRAFFEPRFGHDFGQVRVHADQSAAKAAEQAGTRAFTRGTDIAFGTGQHAPQTTQGRHLLAHELTHVVQQSQGNAAPLRESAPRGILEREAHHIGERAARGGDVTASVWGRAETGSRQCWGEGEHREIGNEAALQTDGSVRRVPLGSGYTLEYGEMVAMAGDYFGSPDLMRKLAAGGTKGVGSQEELEYVRRVKIRGEKVKQGDGKFDDKVMATCDARYFELAGNNRSHFLNPTVADAGKTPADRAGVVGRYKGKAWQAPRNASEGYRQAHVQALESAVALGKAGSAIDQAHAIEAFGCHYLTDAFSAGHVRTPRADLKTVWDEREPMFVYNLTGFIAERIAENYSSKLTRAIGASEDLKYHGIGPKKGSLDTVRAMMATKKFTFGDLVSGAVHDWDNEHGVEVTIGGKDATIYGDGHLNKDVGGGVTSKVYPVAAVKAGLAELTTAYEQAKGGAAVDAVIDGLLVDGLFAAESLLPKAKPDGAVAAERKSVPHEALDAHFLLANAGFRRALEVFLAEKYGVLQEVASELTDAGERKAFEDGVLKPLKSDPVTTVQQVLVWTPDTGGGVRGHNQDDNANDYYKEAKRSGGLQSLSHEARHKLIADLLSGATVGDDEDAIMGILTSADDSEAQRLIDSFGWKRLYDEIDDWSGEDFKERFPKARYGKSQTAP